MKKFLPDARAILSLPFAYRVFNFLVGAERYYTVCIKKYIRPGKSDRVLDIGCGLSDILDYMGEVEYLGFDMSQAYINEAIRRYGSRATFVCKKVSKDSVREKSYFTIALATGILHHLNDDEAIELFELGRHALKPDGRLITIDGCYIPRQSGIVRFILSRDRGNFVRTREEYLKLASRVFSRIRVDIRHDLLNIPYTHIILECRTQ